MSFRSIPKLALTSATALVLLLSCGPSWAQKKKAAPAGDQPAISTTADLPAVQTAPGSPSVGKGAPNNGTTIIGERESPIGLYITPWRNAAAEVDIDRPARLLSVRLDPMDRKVFTRQIDYYEALTAAQKAKAGPAPAAAPAPTP